MQGRLGMRFSKAILAVVAGASLLAAPGNASLGGVQDQRQDPGGSRYKIGSGNTATADPWVVRPKTTPCEVELFLKDEFDNYNAMPFNFTPPANCPGPWAKVVFNANFNVTKGVQYDRTGNIWVNNAAIYFGTTAEPSGTLGPNWHVETDITDYSSLFTAPTTGEVILGNTVNGQYNGIIYGTAWLQFYPLEPGQPAPVTADQVLALSAGDGGGTVALNSGTDMLSETFTLPTNVERAYLDVFAQGQQDDEFWYTCVPNDVSGELQSCGNTAFREADITIDGTPAGVAPIYPWIFTGGIDPYLWIPTPGVQTLNFVAYRADLTPFAGVLSNGQAHTVALSVYNADQYFSATANLLVYLDHGSQQVTGAVTKNTLAAPNPNVLEDLTNNNGTITGTVTTTNEHKFVISGYAVTSHGQVKTTVEQDEKFSNVQTFDIVPNTTYDQDITQGTTVKSETIREGGNFHSVETQEFDFPATVDINIAYQSNGTLIQTTNIQQTYATFVTGMRDKVRLGESQANNTVTTTDMLKLTASGQIIGNSGQASSQHYTEQNAGLLPRCYDRLITAANNELATVTDGCGAK
jgi:Peptide N-acetyl-beta-D-glucosaminyl asparaginase amidase A